jgi:hypothetical protein
MFSPLSQGLEQRIIPENYPGTQHLSANQRTIAIFFPATETKTYSRTDRPAMAYHTFSQDL